jgi:hypothetical protein
MDPTTQMSQEERARIAALEQVSKDGRAVRLLREMADAIESGEVRTTVVAAGQSRDSRSLRITTTAPPTTAFNDEQPVVTNRSAKRPLIRAEPAKQKQNSGRAT